MSLLACFGCGGEDGPTLLSGRDAGSDHGANVQRDGGHDGIGSSGGADAERGTDARLGDAAWADQGSPDVAGPPVDMGSGGGGGGNPPPDMGQPPPDANPPDTGTGPTPRQPATLLVYTANVENLPKTSDGCPGDWKDLFAYMAIQPEKPDLFFVQQVTDLAQLQQITGYMQTSFGRPYSGVIAEADPRPFNSPCGAQKEKQTNAIVYATDRLQAVGSPRVWQSFKNANGVCVRDTLSRTYGIAHDLLDLVSAEHIAAASIHWSTRNGAGSDPACAQANAVDTVANLGAVSANPALLIFGGDTNEPDTVTHDTTSQYNPWYLLANGELGGAILYRDPIWSMCSAGDLRACLVRNWTFRGNNDRRIDFLFGRTPTGYPEVLRAHTVTFNEGDDADLQLTGTDNASVGYSDHRSVLWRLRY